MKNNTIFNNILPLLPLLVFYIVLILVFSSDSLMGDENRYIGYAENMLQGAYTDADNPNLTNGPAYPLLLLPFVALNMHIMVLKLLNGIIVFIGVFYFYKTVQLYAKQKYALIFAFAMGLYPPLLRWMTVLYSEALAFTFLCAFIFHFCYLYKHKKHIWKNGILASLFLGLLVLTKVIFVHVMLVCAILLAIIYLTKNRQKSKWSIFILIGALVVIMPYVVYAYSVTGKLFYLGNRGGEILYHRSTPFENELGNWFSFDHVINGLKNDQSNTYQDLSELSANHRDFYLQVQPLTITKQDSVFKAKAFANMKKYPLKYVKNTIANTGRFLFNYPMSYRTQNLNAFGYIIPNTFLLVLFILILYPAFLSRKQIPFEIIAQLLFVFIYGGGMLLLGGKVRYFIIMVPSMVLFFAYVYSNTLKLSFKKLKENA